jgi:gamma-carbonic anhydrase
MAAIIQAFGEAYPKIAGDAFVADGAAVIGDVSIGAKSSIWFGAILRGDVNYIRIGVRTNIQDGTIIHVTTNGNPTLIGDEVTVGHGAVLHACTLEDRCFVGMRACLLDGVVVEEGGMVAAGALVTENKRVKRGELWAGVPAKPMRNLSEEEIAAITKSATHYSRIALAYRGGPAYP